jgi:EmrB/QacA subfamily drug resistance transporter
VTPQPDATAKRIVLAIALLAGFITPFDGSSVNIALPVIGAEFAMGAVTLSWVATAYLLAAAVFLVPFGRIADIHGRKKVFATGLSLFTLASFLLIFSPSSTAFILLRVMQGCGSAMIFGTGVAILTSVFPPGERGQALGLYTTAVYLGLSMGPFLGGLMTHHLGWRSIFLVNVPLGVLTVLLIRWKLPGEWAEARGQRFDLVGSLIYGFSLVALILGLTLLPEITGAALIATGVVSLYIFSTWELRQESPVLNMRLFAHNRVFAFSNLAALINYSATYAITFLLSLYLQYIQAFTPQTAGTVLIVQPLVQVFISPFAGRLSDRVEPGKVASMGMGVISIGLVSLAFLSESTSIPILIGSLILLGFGMALFSSPNTNAIMSSVEKTYYSVASGTLGTMRLLGQMFSMGLTAMVFAIIIGHVQITPVFFPAFLQSIHLLFILFIGLCLIGIVASLVRGRVRG